MFGVSPFKKVCKNAQKLPVLLTVDANSEFRICNLALYYIENQRNTDLGEFSLKNEENLAWQPFRRFSRIARKSLCKQNAVFRDIL